MHWNCWIVVLFSCSIVHDKYSCYVATDHSHRTMFWILHWLSRHTLIFRYTKCWFPQSQLNLQKIESLFGSFISMVKILSKFEADVNKLPYSVSVCCSNSWHLWLYILFNALSFVVWIYFSFIYQKTIEVIRFFLQMCLSESYFSYHSISWNNFVTLKINIQHRAAVGIRVKNSH